MSRAALTRFVAVSGVLAFVATSTPVVHAAGSLIISEFRLRGPGGANDEFIEIYNDSNAPHTVAAISGTGYAIAASDGVTRCTIPNGTVIPARGHWLCTNSVAYSLGLYAAGDGSYTNDIGDNAGIALFNNNTGGGSFSLANRFDAVGSASEANTLYKEGSGYPGLGASVTIRSASDVAGLEADADEAPEANTLAGGDEEAVEAPALMQFSIDYSFQRDECGKSGSITAMGACTISTPKDTDNNAVDFFFNDTNGTSAGAGQRLGAPGPQNLASPIQRNAGVGAFLLDATLAASSVPNRVRDFTTDPANNSSFGTIELRRRFVNGTGAPVTRLRFRIIDITTFPAPSGFADLRARAAATVIVAGINDALTCSSTGAPTTPPCTVTVLGTTLEEPPSQPNGAGFNGSLAAGTISLATPLAAGDSVDMRLLFGIQQTGNFKIYLNIEALP